MKSAFYFGGNMSQIIDEINSLELAELNKKLGAIREALKELDCITVTEVPKLKQIKGKFYVDTITLEIIPVTKKTEIPTNRPQPQVQSQFSVTPLRTLEQPAARNSIDVY